MLKLLQPEFVKNQKNKEVEDYIFNCETEAKDGRKFWKCVICTITILYYDLIFSIMLNPQIEYTVLVQYIV